MLNTLSAKHHANPALHALLEYDMQKKGGNEIFLLLHLSVPVNPALLKKAYLEFFNLYPFLKASLDPETLKITALADALFDQQCNLFFDRTKHLNSASTFFAFKNSDRTLPMVGVAQTGFHELLFLIDHHLVSATQAIEMAGRFMAVYNALEENQPIVAELPQKHSVKKTLTISHFSLRRYLFSNLKLSRMFKLNTHHVLQFSRNNANDNPLLISKFFDIEQSFTLFIQAKRNKVPLKIYMCHQFINFFFQNNTDCSAQVIGIPCDMDKEGKSLLQREFSLAFVQGIIHNSSYNSLIRSIEVLFKKTTSWFTKFKNFLLFKRLNQLKSIENKFAQIQKWYDAPFSWAFCYFNFDFVHGFYSLSTKINSCYLIPKLSELYISVTRFNQKLAISIQIPGNFANKESLGLQLSQFLEKLTQGE